MINSKEGNKILGMVVATTLKKEMLSLFWLKEMLIFNNTTCNKLSLQIIENIGVFYTELCNYLCIYLITFIKAY